MIVTPCEAQCRVGLLFDKPNIVPVCIGFRCSGMYVSAMLLSAGGAAESLAHHKVVGRREKEREPWRGGTSLSGVHFQRLRCPQVMPRLKT